MNMEEIWVKLLDAGVSLFIMAIGGYWMFNFFQKQIDKKEIIIQQKDNEIKALNEIIRNDAKSSLKVLNDVNHILNEIPKETFNESKMKDEFRDLKDFIRDLVQSMLNR